MPTPSGIPPDNADKCLRNDFHDGQASICLQALAHMVNGIESFAASRPIAVGQSGSLFKSVLSFLEQVFQTLGQKLSLAWRRQVQLAHNGLGAKIGSLSLSVGLVFMKHALGIYHPKSDARIGASYMIASARFVKVLLILDFCKESQIHQQGAHQTAMQCAKDTEAG